MIAAYLTFFLVSVYQLNYFLAILLAMAAVAALGMAMERLAFRPVRRASGATMLLTSFAVAVLLQLAFQLFISTRPAEKVTNEVSMIVGYPQKPGVDATATIGSANFVLYTQNDGAWVKNAAEEPEMVETMRRGADLVLKSVSALGTKTTDTFSLKGLGQALDKVAEECK
jgi:branched-subunit amino acid ABC-type transport system permease component